ncbi:hypothetical protein IWQ60_010958 [Tieghemiomyces parasiticus]|uniref:Peptidase S49 domain-containing protein n=1 Tax=Tieghemiomyces parasiticus TaxID=78921 RepID=A0A9W7ZJR3_9FUNG|nr:hypothetical protein IWQ60_010958 [Tieghemiomyces parasiticus]
MASLWLRGARQRPLPRLALSRALGLSGRVPFHSSVLRAQKLDTVGEVVETVEAPKHPPPPSPPPPPPPSRWFRPWYIFGAVVLVGGAAFSLSQYIAYLKHTTVFPHTTLVWRLSPQSLIENVGGGFAGTLGPLSILPGDDNVDPPMTILDAVRALNFAALDTHVERLVVSLGDAGPGPTPDAAQIQEIREAIRHFKEWKTTQYGSTGPRTTLCADSLDSQLTYYLASAFDEVVLQPTGEVHFEGMSRVIPFFKHALERLGIDAFVETRDEYKSFPSILNHTALPPPQRENTEALLRSLNDTIQSDIISSRGPRIAEALAMPADGVPAQLQLLTEEGVVLGRSALARGLVDKLGYRLDTLAELKGTRTMPLHRFLRCTTTAPGRRKRADQFRVGVVYLTGNITRSGPTSASRVAQAIREAADNAKINAIVLRVNSGGGDPVGSDTIAHAVDYAQNIKRKPVVASYAGVAASGAYLATAPCAQIVAQPLTVTGSIGVAMAKLTLTNKFLDRLGVTVDKYQFGNTANSLLHLPTPDDVARFRLLADTIYGDFLQRVQTGRGFTTEHLRSVAGGRVFTGAQALNLGLVDHLGGLLDAIGYAVVLHLDRVAHRPTADDTDADQRVLLKRYTAPEGVSMRVPGGEEGDEPTTVTVAASRHMFNTLVASNTEVQVFPRPKSLFKRIWPGMGKQELTHIVAAEGQTWVDALVRSCAYRFLALTAGELESQTGVSARGGPHVVLSAGPEVPK